MMARRRKDAGGSRRVGSVVGMVGGISDDDGHVADAAESGLPDGRQLAVTWGIPDRFGGMTSALLHRSRAFVRLGGRDVDVVTFDPRPDVEAIRGRLVEAGELVPGMRLRNLYEDVRDGAWPTPGAGARHPLARPEVDDLDVRVAPDGGELRTSFRGGVRVLVEHARADGSVAVRDERHRAAGPERLITAFAPEGAPLHQWTRAWDCYADWLDGVIGSDRAFAITDSKTVARFMARHRRPNLVSLHVVHNSHLAGPERPWGVLRPSRRSVLAHLERFDGVVFLTERQREDAATLLSDPGNLAVVPNGIDAPGDGVPGDRAPADRDRAPAAGVVLARLTTRKRIDHAVEAVRRCRAAGVPATLVVYGDGPDAAALQARVDEAGLADAVAFAGHRPDAADAFSDASWTLVTSTFEGSPLVLAEAMARGCLPIAYDIPYGPADLITDGVDGALVPDGDIDAAAAAIARLVARSPDDRDRMRHAARSTAAAYDDRSIVAEWGRVLRAAAERHDRPAPPLDVALERLRLRYRRGRLRVSARLRGVPDGATVVITLRRRGQGPLVRTRRPARDGRIVLRLGGRATRFVGGRHPLACVVEVEHGASRVEAGSVTAFPDARSLPRRAVHRVLRGRTDRAA